MRKVDIAVIYRKVTLVTMLMTYYLTLNTIVFSNFTTDWTMKLETSYIRDELLKLLEIKPKCSYRSSSIIKFKDHEIPYTDPIIECLWDDDDEDGRYRKSKQDTEIIVE
jgi:hypothetical protein